MKIAVPDMISNSYFPAEAAVELRFFRDEGLDVKLEMIFPVDKAYMALRDGAVDFVGGSAHSALAAFPQWGGVKLICAQAQGMYWFLVMHQDFAARRGDVDVVKGRNIGAAPWVEMGLRRLLNAAGIDLERNGVKIAPVPGASGASVNFGDSPRRRHWRNERSMAFGPTAWAPKWRFAAASEQSCSTCGAVMGRKGASATPWRLSRPRNV